MWESEYIPKNPNPLLSRDDFREGVFKRDNHTCIMCQNPAQDAHHILERRLFSDGGYYISNGASLCGECHLKAETTEISVEEIREKLGIKKKVLPPHLYTDVIYTKWGDTILSNGMRTPGELFHDESVQKVLKAGNMLDRYTQYIKYPRTYHVPYSGYIGEDDRIQNDMSIFKGDIVVTEKLDGENTTMYNDHIHARSVDGNSHWTQSYVKQLHSTIAYDIPKNFRICGENMFAKHSIKYDNLKSYFYVFSIWNEKNICLSWDDTCEWAALFGLATVPVLYRGQWDDSPEKLHKHIWEKKIDETRHEGYVIRNAGEFSYGQFRTNTMKYVRKNHVTSASHWKFSNIEQNELQHDN